MNNEYITKSQAIDLAESLRPIAGNGITDAFIKGIEGVEGCRLLKHKEPVDGKTIAIKLSLEIENTLRGWISVKNRLPDPQQEVLVSVLNDVLFRDIARVGSLDSQGIWRVDTPHEYFHRNITHWMPLPEPPKE